MVQIHGALRYRINRIVAVRHTRNVLAQVRFLVDALEPNGSPFFDNLANSHWDRDVSGSMTGS